MSQVHRVFDRVLGLLQYGVESDLPTYNIAQVLCDGNLPIPGFPLMSINCTYYYCQPNFFFCALLVSLFFLLLRKLNNADELQALQPSLSTYPLPTPSQFWWDFGGILEIGIFQRHRLLPFSNIPGDFYLFLDVWEMASISVSMSFTQSPDGLADLGSDHVSLRDIYFRLRK